VGQLCNNKKIENMQNEPKHPEKISEKKIFCLFLGMVWKIRVLAPPWYAMYIISYELEGSAHMSHVSNHGG
jgi:hypothetical protein